MSKKIWFENIPFILKRRCHLVAGNCVLNLLLVVSSYNESPTPPSHDPHLRQGGLWKKMKLYKILDPIVAGNLEGGMDTVCEDACCPNHNWCWAGAWRRYSHRHHHDPW